MSKASSPQLQHTLVLDDRIFRISPMIFGMIRVMATTPTEDFGEVHALEITNPSVSAGITALLGHAVEEVTAS